MTDETDPTGDRIRAASRSVSAPLHLREELDRRREPVRRPGPGRLRLALVGAMLAAVATIAAIVAPPSVTVERAAAAGLHGPERAAPADARDYLPGFQAVGARTDKVGGREAVTVIYARGGVGVHYTIVDGKPLDLPGTRHATAGSLKLSLARDGDVSLVSWHARGKTCILASRGAAPDDLVALLRRA